MAVNHYATGRCDQAQFGRLSVRNRAMLTVVHGACHNAGMGQGAHSAANQQPTLQRSLSLPLTTLYGLGNILGAGIYVLIGKVVGHAGVFAPLSFLLASLLAGLTAFTYAELSARFPLSAGEAVYVREGIGLRFMPALVGILIILAGVVSAATILRGFAGYLQVFFPAPDVAVIVMANAAKAVQSSLICDFTFTPSRLMKAKVPIRASTVNGTSMKKT